MAHGHRLNHRNALVSLRAASTPWRSRPRLRVKTRCRGVPAASATLFASRSRFRSGAKQAPPASRHVGAEVADVGTGLSAADLRDLHGRARRVTRFIPGGAHERGPSSSPSTPVHDRSGLVSLSGRRRCWPRPSRLSAAGTGVPAFITVVSDDAPSRLDARRHGWPRCALASARHARRRADGRARGGSISSPSPVDARSSPPGCPVRPPP